MPTSRIPWFVVKAASVASLGGILFGYDMGVISGALPQLAKTFDLSDKQQESVVGILYLGGGIGAAFGGMLCDAVGRKRTIMITDLLFCSGALIIYMAPTINQVLAGRVVLGFGISVSGIADVAYLHEMAPVEWRGSIVSVNEACIALGFLLAFCAGYLLHGLSEGWRIMFGLSGWMAIIQLIGIWSMPESPLWLQRQGREDERLAALTIIYDGNIPSHVTDNDYISGQEIDKANTTQTPGTSSSYEQLSRPELGQPQQQQQRQQQPAHSSSVAMFGWIWRVCIMMDRYRPQVLIALFMAIAQQLSGQASVLNYAPVIFASLHSSSLSGMLWIGFVKFFMTVLVIWRIEYMGRRFLLLAGMAVIVLGQFLVAAAFRAAKPNEDGEVSASSSMVWALPGVLLVVTGYSVSFGPLSWLLTSELFPTNVRGRALGASTVFTYLAASAVTSTFLSMQSALGFSTVFVLYGLVTAFGMVFAFVAIPETGGKTITDIEDDLRRMSCWRSQRRRDSDHANGLYETELT